VTRCNGSRERPGSGGDTVQREPGAAWLGGWRRASGAVGRNAGLGLGRVTGATVTSGPRRHEPTALGRLDHLSSLSRSKGEPGREKCLILLCRSNLSRVSNLKFKSVEPTMTSTAALKVHCGSMPNSFIYRFCPKRVDRPDTMDKTNNDGHFSQPLPGRSWTRRLDCLDGREGWPVRGPPTGRRPKAPPTLGPGPRCILRTAGGSPQEERI
jgi:hypothetical protein